MHMLLMLESFLEWRCWICMWFCVESKVLADADLILLLRTGVQPCRGQASQESARRFRRGDGPCPLAIRIAPPGFHRREHHDLKHFMSCTVHLTGHVKALHCVPLERAREGTQGFPDGVCIAAGVP